MSTLALSTISNLAGTASTSSDNVIQGCAKAWVNFNGTGTVAIRASYNVSSITDNGTGDYTINFTNALPDANYSIAGTAGTFNALFGTVQLYNSAGTNPSTTALRFNTTGSGWTVIDPAYVCVAIFR
jgi:hypothetical protein